MLQRYSGRAFLDIELKVVGLEEIVVKLLQKNPPQRGFVVSSFLPDALVALKGKMSLGLICETQEELNEWSRLAVDYVIPHYLLVSEGLVRDLRKARKKIMVWTVNEPREMSRLKDLGVDGIISDHPELLCRTMVEKM